VNHFIINSKTLADSQYIHKPKVELKISYSIE